MSQLKLPKLFIMKTVIILVRPNPYDSIFYLNLKAKINIERRDIVSCRECLQDICRDLTWGKCVRQRDYVQKKAQLKDFGNSVAFNYLHF